MHDTSNLRPIVRLLAIVFALYFVTGASLSVLPLHVQDVLGYGPVAVGMVTGAQFGAAVVFRFVAGRLTDRRGSRSALLWGSAAAVAGAGCYALSTLPSSPAAGLAILLAGRALLGAGESLTIVGGQTWGLELAGDSGSGRIIGWVGTALFLGLAVGSPAGSGLADLFDFWGLVALTAALPAVAAFLVPAAREGTKGAQSEDRISTWATMRRVWRPGLAMSLPTLSYGVMVSFSVLLFAERGWAPAWLGFTLFAGALTLVRIVAGGLTDRFGGARVAMASVVVQAGGMLLVAFGPGATFGFAGAVIAGAGYALVYPGMALVALDRAGKSDKGAAIGIFSAFLDLALGLAGPGFGAVAQAAGLQVVFAVAAAAALMMVPMAWDWRGMARDGDS